MSTDRPVFARDPATAAYYDQRATEYDGWYLGTGQFATRDRPGWTAEVDDLVNLVRDLPPGRTLDVACGSGFLTRHLHGLVVGLDQSRSMVALAQSRLPHGVVMLGDALDLPFADDSFDRIVTAHSYGHLPPDERAAFLTEARRVARELVVIDAAQREDPAPEQWQERVLNDGSHHRVFKRYFRARAAHDRDRRSSSPRRGMVRRSKHHPADPLSASCRTSQRHNRMKSLRRRIGDHTRPSRTSSQAALRQRGRISRLRSTT